MNVAKTNFRPTYNMEWKSPPQEQLPPYAWQKEHESSDFVPNRKERRKKKRARA